MRILYASTRPPYPFFLGGAARCAHRLLLSLAQDEGATVLAVGSADYAVTAWAWPPADEFDALGIRGDATPAGRASAGERALDCGYPVQVLPDFAPRLEALVDDFRPDVIWSQLEGAHEVLSLARRKGVQGLLYVHDAEDDPRALRATAALGCHVVCSSTFLAGKVRRVIGRPATVVYPASDWYFGTQGDAQGFVTMINPHAVKGLDTFLDVAQRMPGQRFLLQESWKLGDEALARLLRRIEDLPNVRFQHRVADMRAVYAQTRLLVVPSVWEEGFGMVAVEAQSCGIPVIASARGGLPESVGTGGVLIDDYRNSACWVAAIERLLSDERHGAQWSAQALAHARSPAFAPRQGARTFLSVCRAPAPPNGTWARAWRALETNLGHWPERARKIFRKAS